MSDAGLFVLWAAYGALTATGCLLLGRWLVLSSLRRGAEEARNLGHGIGWTQDALIHFLLERAEGRPAELEIEAGYWVRRDVSDE